MAKINGIEIKAVKMFRGHEGEPLFQGNLYLNGKKIGFWSNDSWDAPNNYIMDPRYSNRLLEDKITKIYKGVKKTPIGITCGVGYELDYDLDQLIEELLWLRNLEKEFKDYPKRKKTPEGYEYGMLVLWPKYGESKSVCFHYRKDADKENVKGKVLEEKYIKESIRVLKEHDGKEPDVVWYFSKKDFEVGEAISLQEIERSPTC